MKLPLENTVSGQWIDKATLKNGDFIKIVSEAKIEQGKDGEQLVAKAKVKGVDEVKNVAINKPSRKAIVEVYGDDTDAWINKVFTVALERVLIGGQRKTALYLIPEGYHLGEDAGGYLVVEPSDSVSSEARPASSTPKEEEIDPADIPF